MSSQACPSRPSLRRTSERHTLRRCFDVEDSSRGVHLCPRGLASRGGFPVTGFIASESDRDAARPVGEIVGFWDDEPIVKSRHGIGYWHPALGNFAWGIGPGYGGGWQVYPADPEQIVARHMASFRYDPRRCVSPKEESEVGAALASVRHVALFRLELEKVKGGKSPSLSV